jgi:hypothetical protein
MRQLGSQMRQAGSCHLLSTDTTRPFSYHLFWLYCEPERIVLVTSEIFLHSFLSALAIFGPRRVPLCCTMSSLRKRTGSPHLAKPRIKCARQDVIIISDGEEEESMQTILRRIKEREDSEALTRIFQNKRSDMNVTSALPTASSSGLHDRDVISIDSGSEEESDEAMARRLAREWGENPHDSINAILLTSDSTLHSDSAITALDGMTSSRSSTNIGMTPDEKLSQCRSIFIGERDCSKCGLQVQSPRGYVCHCLLHYISREPIIFPGYVYNQQSSPKPGKFTTCTLSSL